MNNSVYIWDKADGSCYAVASRTLASAAVPGLWIPLCFNESGERNGTQADLQRQLCAQSWYRPEYGFPVLGVDPIPF